MRLPDNRWVYIAPKFFIGTSCIPRYENFCISSYAPIFFFCFSKPDRIREFIRAVYVDKKYAGGKSTNKPATDSEVNELI
jgi:hypothetical protein